MELNIPLLLLLVVGGCGVLVLGITGLCIICRGAVCPKKSCDYILVLGADSRFSESRAERIRRCCEYLTEYPDTIAIVTGGKGENEPISEAQGMFDSLTAIGIDPKRIWIEDKATSTWENLKFSMELIEKKTGTRPPCVCVVSSDYHLFRVGLHGRRQGLRVQGIPAKTEHFSRWLPLFIREIAGVWHFFILGGLYD